VFKNIYDTGSKAYSKVKVDELKQKLLKQKGNIFSSHPAVSQRMKKVARFPKREAKKKTSARSLFKDITELEKEMTAELTGIIFYKLGIINEKGEIIKRKGKAK